MNLMHKPLGLGTTDLTSIFQGKEYSKKGFGPL